MIWRYEIVQKKFFENFDFLPYHRDFPIKKGSEPPNGCGNMPLRCDKIIGFVLGCHFQKSKNIKNPKMAISRLLSMFGSFTTTQIKGFRMNFLYSINTLSTFLYHLSKKTLKPVQVPICEVPNFSRNINKDVFRIQHKAFNF